MVSVYYGSSAVKKYTLRTAEPILVVVAVQIFTHGSTNKTRSFVAHSQTRKNEGKVAVGRMIKMTR